jgi:hypothetical protein
MAKKLTLPLAALAVILALIVPATAAAEDVLLPVGTEIKISTKVLKLTSSKLGTIECGETEWVGVLTENGGKLLIPKMPGSGKACFRAGAEVKMTETKIEPTKIAESEAEKGTGTISWTFAVELSPGGTVCHFTGTNDVFTWTKGTDKSAVNAGALTVTPVACGTTAAVDALEMTDQYKGEKGWEPVKWL